MKNVDSGVGGNVIFSNANTYTGGTELRSGFIGLGANNCLGTGTLTIGYNVNPLGLYAVGATRSLTNDIYADVNSPTLATSVGSTNLQIRGSQNITLTGRILIHTNFMQFTISNTATTTISGIITNAATTSQGIVKKGPGRLALSGVNTFSGSTLIAGGTLALNGSGSFKNTTNLTLYGGATLDLSGLAGTLKLTNSQTLRILSQNSLPATLVGSGASGLILSNSSPVLLEYLNGTPALTIGGGVLNLNNNTITLTIIGAPLSYGNYLLVDTSSGGAVAGVVPNTVTIRGAGLAPGLHGTLQIVGGKLYFTIAALFQAYDFNGGFFGGENLGFTNFSGGNFYAWSSTNPSLSVANWTLEGPMSEIPLGTTGFSKYGINVTPTASPTFYVFGTTNVGPYVISPVPVAILTTSDYQSFTVVSTSVPVSADGVLALTPVVSSSLVQADGSFALQFTGPLGMNYSISASTNLTDWTGITSGVITNLPALFTDTDATNYPDRYYRISLP